MMYLVLEKILTCGMWQEIYIGEDEHKAITAYRKRGELYGRELVFKKVRLDSMEDYFEKDSLSNRVMMLESPLRNCLNSAVRPTKEYRIARFRGNCRDKICFSISIQIKDFIIPEKEVWDCIGYWVKICKQKQKANDIPVVIRLTINKNKPTEKEF